MTSALIPGSFDPVTAGHMDLINRAARLVDILYVGVFVNAEKHPLFSIAQRVHFLELACKDLPNVRIVSDTGLVVEFAQKNQISMLIKGIRSEGDAVYELQMAHINRNMAPSVETLLLPADPAYAQLSSTLVRSVLAEHRPLTGLVPPEIEGVLQD